MCGNYCLLVTTCRGHRYILYRSSLATESGVRHCLAWRASPFFHCLVLICLVSLIIIFNPLFGCCCLINYLVLLGVWSGYQVSDIKGCRLLCSHVHVVYLQDSQYMHGSLTMSPDIIWPELTLLRMVNLPTESPQSSPGDIRSKALTPAKLSIYTGTWNRWVKIRPRTGLIRRKLQKSTSTRSRRLNAHSNKTLMMMQHPGQLQSSANFPQIPTYLLGARHWEPGVVTQWR